MEHERSQLIRRLREEIVDQRVLAAMSRVPRELFVPAECRDLAYVDSPLPIGLEQTISQPYMVALMAQALKLRGVERILEVGTGSGYQAAVLSHLARWVVTVERHAVLAARAQQALRTVDCTNVEIHVGGKQLGWTPGAPYDAILVTAGAPGVPQSLLDQLVEGGHLVIPVGGRHDQHLLRITRQGEYVRRESLVLCRFVPLIGPQAWPDEAP